MGSDLAIAEAGCLTSAEIELATALLNSSGEQEIDDPTFAAVERWAAAPCPVLPSPGQDEFRRIINALAGTLKSPRTSDEQGALQLKMYWAALHDVELFRIQRAAEHLIKTAEWMPTPGQLRTLALTHEHPVYWAHRRARRYVGERLHRLATAQLDRIGRRELGQDELDALSPDILERAFRAGFVVPNPDGGFVYRTREAVERFEEHNREKLRQYLLEGRKEG